MVNPVVAMGNNKMRLHLEMVERDGVKKGDHEFFASPANMQDAAKGTVDCSVALPFAHFS